MGKKLIQPAGPIQHNGGQKWTYLVTLPTDKTIPQSKLAAAFDSAVKKTLNGDGRIWVASRPTKNQLRIFRGADRLLRFTKQYAEGRKTYLMERVQGTNQQTKGLLQSLERYWFTYTVNFGSKNIISVSYHVPKGPAEDTAETIRNSLPFVLFPLVETCWDILRAYNRSVRWDEPLGPWNCCLSTSPEATMVKKWQARLDLLAESYTSRVFDEVAVAIHHQFNPSKRRHLWGPIHALAPLRVLRYAGIINKATANWDRGIQQMHLNEVSLKDMGLDSEAAINRASRRFLTHIPERLWNHSLARLDSMTQIMGIWVGLFGVLVALTLGIGRIVWEAFGTWSLLILFLAMGPLALLHFAASVHAKILGDYVANYAHQIAKNPLAVTGVAPSTN